MNIWHYTKDKDYPKLYGKYEHDHYPQIPCLVHDDCGWGVRYWNVTAQCWDDEHCDNYYCGKDLVEKWAYIDELINIDCMNLD